MKHLLIQSAFLILALQCATFSAAPADTNNLKQLLHKTNVLREYDLAELFHLVYQAAPELVEKSLLELGDGQWPPAEIEDQLIEDQLIDPTQFLRKDENITGACKLCRLLVGFITLRARQDPPMFDKLTENFIKICEAIAPELDVQGDIYCRGTLEHQLEQVFVVVSNSDNKVKEMCEFLNLCFPPPLPKSEQPKKSANFKPNPIKQRTSNSRSRSVPPPNSLKVVQLADVHVEPNYKSGSALKCGLPVCCDPNISGTGSARPWGEYTCNIPQETIELFLGEVKNMNPDIILFSGDVPPHSTWDETQESQTECSRTLVNTLKKILPEHKVYPNVGNHENYPTNLFSVRKMNYTKDFLDFYKDAWKPLANFSDENIKTIGDGGYYSKLLCDGLRLISFNTNYMYTYNFYNVDNHKEFSIGGRPPIKPPTAVYPPEYDVMREFIQEALQNATRDEERVILMGHHPPGSADYIVRGSRWYRELVLNYTDTIVLQPAGHTHYDEFRMIYDDAGTARSVVLVAPSMSSEYTRNPSMRVFFLHNETFELLDYEHYYLNLGLSEAKVELLYSAKEDYGMADLSPESWHQLLLSFESDPDVLNQHRNHSQADAPLGECTEDCQTDYICRMKNVNYDEYKECATKIDWSEIPKPTRPTNPPNVDSAPSLHSFTVITLVISALVLIQTLI